MFGKQRVALLIVGFGIITVAIGLSFYVHPDRTIQAQDGGDSDSPIQPTGDNGYCLLCHSQEGRTSTLTDGTTLDLYVSPEILANSVHGESNPDGALGCIDCHGENAFPHTDTPQSTRELAIESAQICIQCHTDQSEALQDGVHAEGLERGNQRAAVCTDCHGAHDVQPIVDHPAFTAETCGTCHTVVFSEYSESVHGQALLVEGDTNVPTCTTCHGVHGIDRPTNAQFRNRSPELCAECHADEDLMKEYDISTNVFNSYLTDFHGTTVALFDQQDPDVASNKAVCYDCHGVHNITPADDSKSQVAKENLLATCQQCHPDATTDFPDAWVGHFEPTADNQPLLFFVEWFYKILIPLVIGGFVVLVSSDIFRRIRLRV